MKYRPKEGVSLAGLQLVMRPAMMAAGVIWEKQGVSELVITSGTEGSHGANSYHPYGLALDLRLPPDPQAAVDELRTSLGISFDVVLEGNHVHVEYDP